MRRPLHRLSYRSHPRGMQVQTQIQKGDSPEWHRLPAIGNILFRELDRQAARMLPHGPYSHIFSQYKSLGRVTRG